MRTARAKEQKNPPRTSNDLEAMKRLNGPHPPWLLQMIEFVEDLPCLMSVLTFRLHLLCPFVDHAAFSRPVKREKRDHGTANALD